MKSGSFKAYIKLTLLFSGLIVQSFTLLGQVGKAHLNVAKTNILSIQKSFINPPATARPWVYWMWINGYVSKESVTADLEAMNRVGIGGALVLDVDQRMPQGPLKYMDKNWQSVFKHTTLEAKRLGMEMATNNGPGYWGSGGPWITPELGMQWVVSTETYVSGGKKWKGNLKSPATDGAAYKDIAVIAIGVIDTTPAQRYITKDFALKAAQFPGNQGTLNYVSAPLTLKSIPWPGFQRYLGYRGTESAPLDATAPQKVTIPKQKVLDISDKMDADGDIIWNVPDGKWTIIRFGHQFTGSTIGPVIKETEGPETDKLSKEATRLHFNSIVKKLNEVAGAEGRGTASGLVGTHIDSWEGGGQNWTPLMREEFKKRRGYDIVPFLPILTGRVIQDLQYTERFMWDLRKTISELVVENYIAEFQKLTHENGLRVSFEAYTTNANDLDVANYVDEPMAEFWTEKGNAFRQTMKSMASAAHLNSRPIVAAEAMTSDDAEKWLMHPATVKSIADEAFCRGINKLVFHRYSAQYYPDLEPGLMMGPWGLHYERTNTWWEMSTKWHEYVTRCQYLLREGTFVADVLNLQPEEPMYRFKEANLKGYDYDACGTDAFKKITVKEGKLMMPNRPPYRLLVLTHGGTMTVEQLLRIKQLVVDGAAILGNRPKATPGLSNYIEADATLKKIADELWGTGNLVAKRQFGKGIVFNGISTEEALAQLTVKKDFESDKPLDYIHRTINDMDVYFVANLTNQAATANCTFRMEGKSAELWDAETGKTYPLNPSIINNKGITTYSIPFGASKSYFVIFKPAISPNKIITSVYYGNSPLKSDSLNNSGIDLIKKEIKNSGTYTIKYQDGEQEILSVKNLSKPTLINGQWALKFPKDKGAPDEVKLDSLVSWDKHPDDGIKHFSGTATYLKTITINKDRFKKNLKLYMDLGNVAVMAKVKLNGKDLGVLWRPPYQIDISAAAKPGKNELEIEVVNLWPNRLIGDEKLPNDTDFTEGYFSVMMQWPEWILNGEKKSPNGRIAFSTIKLFSKDDELQPSGLLGPVKLFSVFTY